jgi:hypothetical protein
MFWIGCENRIFSICGPKPISNLVAFIENEMRNPLTRQMMYEIVTKYINVDSDTLASNTNVSIVMNRLRRSFDVTYPQLFQ